MAALDRVAAFVRVVGLVAACVLLPAQIALSVGGVVARRFLHFQLTPVQELQWHLFFALVFLTSGSAYLADRHVRIDIVRDRMSERTRAAIEVGGFFLALLPFSLIVLYLGTIPAWDAFIIGERSRAPLGLPYRWIIKSMIPVGALLLLLAGLVVTFRNFQLLCDQASVISHPLQGALRDGYVSNTFHLHGCSAGGAVVLGVSGGPRADSRDHDVHGHWHHRRRNECRDGSRISAANL